MAPLRFTENSMATVKYEPVSAPGSGSVLVVWRDLSSGDEGEPFVPAGSCLVQMTGDFGGAVSLEGTLDPKGSAWFGLTDHDNLAIVKTSPDGEVVREQVYMVRPKAGAGVRNVTVWLYVPA